MPFAVGKITRNQQAMDPFRTIKGQDNLISFLQMHLDKVIKMIVPVEQKTSLIVSAETEQNGFKEKIYIEVTELHERPVDCISESYWVRVDVCQNSKRTIL